MGNVRLLTKDYFNRHPLKEVSAARFEYSMLLQPGLIDALEENMSKLREQGISYPDDSEEKERVEKEEDTDRLIRMLRRGMSPTAHNLLIKKLLPREAKVLPELKRILLKAFNPHTIENCVHYMAKCDSNCSDWIIEHYDEIREPYARSMLCLVLGFRADEDAIPFLMRQVDYFEKSFPMESFEQAPLMALYELRARFLYADQAN